MDALAFERQFLDHLAPVWLALPTRGRFLVETSLADHARGLGIVPTLTDGNAVRRSGRDPGPQPGDGPTALVASYGDIKIGRRLGYRRFAFIEHGIGQSYGGERRNLIARHGSYPGGVDREDVALFLTPNEHSADRWRQAYPSASVVVVGSPRLDSLPRRQPGPGPVAAITFHWPDTIVGNALARYRDVLGDLARSFAVIGHAHPKGDWPERMQRHYLRAGIPFVRDFADVCQQADVLVADNTSVIYEFAATGRPVVLMNNPGWRALRHGLRFSPEGAEVGVNNWDPARLADDVRLALQDGPQQRAGRERALRHVYAYRGAEARRRAVAAILSVTPGERAGAAA